MGDKDGSKRFSQELNITVEARSILLYHLAHTSSHSVWLTLALPLSDFLTLSLPLSLPLSLTLSLTLSLALSLALSLTLCVTL